MTTTADRMFEIVIEDTEGQLFTAQTFLDYLRPSNPIWWNDELQAGTCPWVFRGHGDASWQLIPSAARPLDEKNKLTDIVSGLRRLDLTLPNSIREQASRNSNLLEKIEKERENTIERALLFHAQELVSKKFDQLAGDSTNWRENCL